MLVERAVAKSLHHICLGARSLPKAQPCPESSADADANHSSQVESLSDPYGDPRWKGTRSAAIGLAEVNITSSCRFILRSACPYVNAPVQLLRRRTTCDERPSRTLAREFSSCYEPSERLNGEIKRLTELPIESVIVRITAPSCSNSIWPAKVLAT